MHTSCTIPEKRTWIFFFLILLVALLWASFLLIRGEMIQMSVMLALTAVFISLFSFIHCTGHRTWIIFYLIVFVAILEDLPETDQIVVPVGGGGLIAGISVAAKALKPLISIIGVQALACPSAQEAIRQEHPARVRAGSTIADGIRVAETGGRPFPAIHEFVDRIVLASEDEIADAMLLLLERKHIVAEGAGAAPLAALMNGSMDIEPGSTIVLVISGGNVDSAMLFRIVRQSMARQGRILRFSVILDDHPGALARLLTIIAEKRGNILHIHHTLGESGVPLQMARVHLELETRGRDHIEVIKKAVTGAGYQIKMG